MKFSVINFTPFMFREDKPGQSPDSYIIPPSRDDDKVPGVLTVGNAFSRLYMPLQDHEFHVPVAAEALANDLVRSLLDAMIECERGVAEPAIFYVPGDIAPLEVKSKFPEEVRSALNKQNVWCIRLVKKADDEWQKYRQHKFITDTQRWACKKLNFKREWESVSAAAPLELKDCQWCGTKILTNVAMCPNCKQIVNQALFDSLSGPPKAKVS